MPSIRFRSRVPRNLLEKEYYIKDTTQLSPDYFNITHFPSKIGGGKSLIKLKGNDTNLAINSTLDIEVLDAAGNPVYYEVSPLIDRFNQYYIIISVFDFIPPGFGTIIITGEAIVDQQGQAIPDQWRGKQNVIWSRQIEIRPLERNDSELIFYKQPTVSVAQIVTPQRLLADTLGEAAFTASVAANIFTIVSSDFKGFDKTITTDKDIQDLGIQNIQANLEQKSSTTNTVDTTTRTPIPGGNIGYIVNKTNRYNTTIRAGQPHFTSNFVGGTFEISGSSQNTVLQPQTSSISIGSGSLYSQIDSYKGTIVKVLNEKTALLSKPVSVTAELGNRNIDFTFKLMSGSFAGITTYTNTSTGYITSSAVSQSYLEFTFTDINPLAGQIYKIRPFYKLSGKSTEYTILNDQIVRPVEYLTDAQYPNQTSYGKAISEYYLIGHFVESSSLNRYWTSNVEDGSGFGSNPNITVTSDVQASAVKLIASSSQTTQTSAILTTNFYQNYLQNQAYTVGADLTLDPFTELEVYMSSDTLSINTVPRINYPIAFVKSQNQEKTRYADNQNRFGKLIGYIKNNTPDRVQYGRVEFDFETDSEGLGKPLFRSKVINNNTTGSVYLSEIGLTPTTLNGFTPNLVQFAVPIDLTVLQATSLSQSIDLKLEYFDYTGNQSEYVTYIKQIPLNFKTQINTNSCQAEQYNWSFDTPVVNAILSGSVATWPLSNDTSSTSFYTTPTQVSYLSGSTYNWWPAVEKVSGFYNIDGDNYFTTDYKIFGIQYSTSDVSLWNVQRPILIDSSSNLGTKGGSISHSSDYPPYDGTNYGSMYQKIKSSWNWVTKFTENFGIFTTTGLGADKLAEYITGSAARLYTGSAESSIIDNRLWLYEGCLGITQANVLNSYNTEDLYRRAGESSNRVAIQDAIKTRRLMFPMNGTATGSYFTTNGGIYNVKFKLKRSGSYSPDTGSYMDVYIFNANAPYTASVGGYYGWRPPTNNIVRIGHKYQQESGLTTPIISNYDPVTGYYYDEYDIILIQYGDRAQLVFEPGGYTNNTTSPSGYYFGTLIDDISFCKIGITTDPDYIEIKPAYTNWLDIYRTSIGISDFGEP